LWVLETPQFANDKYGYIICIECEEYREGTGLARKVEQGKGKFVESIIDHAEKKDGERWIFKDY
jgi:hypothetical protein